MKDAPGSLGDAGIGVAYHIQRDDTADDVAGEMDEEHTDDEDELQSRGGLDPREGSEVRHARPTFEDDLPFLDHRKIPCFRVGV